MTKLFSLGVNKLWDELAIMQSPGLYWMCVERPQDTTLFCRQILASQPENTKGALICAGQDPKQLLTPTLSSGPKKLPLFTLEESNDALWNLSEDLMRGLKPQGRLLLLNVSAHLWQNFSDTQLMRWCNELNQWLKEQDCTLLILSHGNEAHTLKLRLLPLSRILNGLVNIEWRQEYVLYSVAWWCTNTGISAGVILKLEMGSSGWQLRNDEELRVQVSNDENLYLAHHAVLEGAPPLSEYWFLYANNQELSDRAMQAQTATVIFALQNSDQVNDLAKLLHSLRIHRGNALKLVIREVAPSLRYSDERLLLACGANLIVPHLSPLSRFLTMLESVQGTTFPRHIPTNLSSLLDAMRPLQVKGYVPLPKFCQYLHDLMNNALLLENSKGILVALKPVPGLRAAQALTLCHIRRHGDLITIYQDRVYLFLSACRVNDLDTALRFIFRLPVDEVFVNRLVWHTDKQVLSEVSQLEHSTVSQWHPEEERIINQLTQQSESVEPEPRREPEPITLLLD